MSKQNNVYLVLDECVDATTVFGGKVLETAEASKAIDALAEWAIGHPCNFWKSMSFKQWTRCIEAVKTVAADVFRGGLDGHFKVTLDGDGTQRITAVTEAARIVTAIHEMRGLLQ